MRYRVLSDRIQRMDICNWNIEAENITAMPFHELTQTPTPVVQRWYVSMSEVICCYIGTELSFHTTEANMPRFRPGYSDEHLYFEGVKEKDSC